MHNFAAIGSNIWSTEMCDNMIWIMNYIKEHGCQGFCNNWLSGLVSRQYEGFYLFFMFYCIGIVDSALYCSRSQFSNAVAICQNTIKQPSFSEMPLGYRERESLIKINTFYQVTKWISHVHALHFCESAIN